MIKCLVNLKQKCISAETENRSVRGALKELKSEFAALSLAGNRNIESNHRIVHGNFAFLPRSENQSAREPTEPTASKVSTVSERLPLSRTPASDAESTVQESPALRHLLSTDHLVFSSYSRQALLKDLDRLTRHLDSMESDTALLKVQLVRLQQQSSIQQRRARFPRASRPDRKQLPLAALQVPLPPPPPTTRARARRPVPATAPSAPSAADFRRRQPPPCSHLRRLFGPGPDPCSPSRAPARSARRTCGGPGPRAAGTRRRPSPCPPRQRTPCARTRPPCTSAHSHGRNQK